MRVGRISYKEFVFMLHRKPFDARVLKTLPNHTYRIVETLRHSQITVTKVVAHMERGTFNSAVDFKDIVFRSMVVCVPPTVLCLSSVILTLSNTL